MLGLWGLTTTYGTATLIDGRPIRCAHQNGKTGEDELIQPWKNRQPVLSKWPSQIGNCFLRPADCTNPEEDNIPTRVPIGKPPAPRYQGRTSSAPPCS